MNGILNFDALTSMAEMLGRGRPVTLRSIQHYRGEITIPAMSVATELRKTSTVVSANECKHSVQNNSTPAHAANSICQPTTLN
jgi:hypothetical protein